MTKIFIDGATEDILQYNNDPFVKGFTTNPTLMRKAGVENYENYCKYLLSEIKEKPVSFEVFADEQDEMIRQADKIASWGDNVYIKIPVTNTKNEPTDFVIQELLGMKIKVNVTAIMTIPQVSFTCATNGEFPTKSIVSVFAGRIADACHDYLGIMEDSKIIVDEYNKCLTKNNTFKVSGGSIELLWASTREVYNIIQAQALGVDIITCSPTIYEKYKRLHGKDLNDFSLETVQMFYNDAKEAGYKL